jgi:hypothetical protein
MQFSHLASWRNVIAPILVPVKENDVQHFADSQFAQSPGDALRVKVPFTPGTFRAYRRQLFHNPIREE